MYDIQDFFEENNILNKASFHDLGYISNNGKNILTFTDNIFYLKKALKKENISAIIIKKGLEQFIDQKITKGLILSENPRDDFFNLYEKFAKKKKFEVDFSYGLGKNVEIAKSAIISKKSYIGDNCQIADNVVIKDNVYIGNDCFIDSGSIIGCDGILYTKKNGNNYLIRHHGSVHISNNVSILSNAVVVKSIFPQTPTKIGAHCIIGISTTIGHEAYLENNVRILGNCVVAKSSKIGEDSLIGSSSVIRENIIIGKNASIKAGSIVVDNILDKQIVSGNFAYNHNKHVKTFLKAKKDD